MQASKKPQITKRIQKVIVKNKPKKVVVRKPARRSFTDNSTIIGFESLAQTLFSGQSGIHRGLALGAQTTALCRFRQVVDVTIPGGTYLTYAWSPVAINNAPFNYAAGTGATNPTDPFNSTGISGVTTVPVPGPFSAFTNPSLEWRVVRASMRWTNTGQQINIAGDQFHGYASNVYNGAPSFNNLQTFPAGPANWSLTSFENLEFFKTFPATVQTRMQWFPNDDEIYIEPPATWIATTTPLSGFVGYIYGGPAGLNAQTFHVEFDYGIEYIPNTSYRPYVERYLPTCHPNAFYELNKFVGKNWDKLVVCTEDQYLETTSQIEHIPAALSKAFNLANMVSTPSLSLPILQSATLFERMCDASENITGVDVCGTAGDLAAGMGSKLMQGALNAVMPNHSAIML